MNLIKFFSIFLVSVICVNGQTIKVNDFLFGGSVEFIDLTHHFNNDTLSWPGNQKFTFTKKFAGRRSNGIWYSSNEFCAAEHGGTHIDAPYHFAAGKWTLGQIPFDNFIAPLTVVDVSNLVAGDPNFILLKSHMDNLFYLDPRRNHTIIFRFGWSQYFGDESKYYGTSIPNQHNLRFPGISEEVAKWLTETSQNIVGVGVDTSSVDAGSALTHPVHQIFAAKNIYMLENLKIEKTLPNGLCALMVMPMKIQDGTGAPARVAAICPRIHAHNLF